MSNQVKKETETTALAGPRGKRYIMKLADGKYLGYPKDSDPKEELDMIMVDNEEDAILINRSTRSFVEKDYYTWSFYPHGDTKKGKRMDVRLIGDFRRVFGSNHDSLAVSWKPEHETGGRFYMIVPKTPESLRPRLGNKEEKLIAAVNGGFDVTLIEKK